MTLSKSSLVLQTFSTNNWFNTSNQAMADMMDSFNKSNEAVIIAVVKEFAGNPDLSKRYFCTI